MLAVIAAPQGAEGGLFASIAGVGDQDTGGAGRLPLMAAAVKL